MADDKYVTLFKTKKTLELVVFSDEEANCQELRTFANNPSKIPLGSIHFSDPREPERTINEFTRRYVGGGQVEVQAQERKSASVKYPISFEPTITQAFFKYFSEMPLH